MEFVLNTLISSWNLLCQSAVYMLIGLLAAGLIKMFLSEQSVARHLGGRGPIPVLKAALLGIPLPLCSCSVLPAATGLRRGGAGRGATASFLIATPESGVDSLAVTWALLGPLMTVARPLAALATALTAGLLTDLLVRTGQQAGARQVEDGEPQPVLKPAQPLPQRLLAGLRHAVGPVWGDLAGWFALGLLLAGLISNALPPEVVSNALGGGTSSMLLMLLFGIPLYICATASTPIAAALLLKGVSPGAALVFLLAGPATNITSLTVLLGLLGRRATAVYLGSIAVVTVLAGLALDVLVRAHGIAPKALVEQTSEVLPAGLETAAALLLCVLSIKPVLIGLKKRITPLFSWREGPAVAAPSDKTAPPCGCTGSS